MYEFDDHYYDLKESLLITGVTWTDEMVVQGMGGIEFLSRKGSDEVSRECKVLWVFCVNGYWNGMGWKWEIWIWGYEHEIMIPR